MWKRGGFSYAIALLMCIAVAAMGQETVKKYEMKSGIAKMKMFLMGQEIESTVYFDNYGALEPRDSGGFFLGGFGFLHNGISPVRPSKSDLVLCEVCRCSNEL